MRKEFKSVSAVFLAYFLVLVIVYWTTLNGGPLIDDFRLLDTAKHGGWLANFPATSRPGVFWRPMVSIFLKGEWNLFHLNFSGYRLVSAALCALTATAIYAVIRDLTQSHKLALVSGLFFVLWPSHPETVVWIAGQTGGLATCLSWLALWAFLATWKRQASQPLRHILWLVPLIGALLAKESATVMPLLILAISVAVRPGDAKDRRTRTALLAALLLAITIGYLALRAAMIHQTMLGGGYRGGAASGLFQKTLSGLLDFHLTFNLLNAYAPLSGRFFSGFLGLSPDSYVTILLVFGVGAVIRRLPRGPRPALLERRLVPYAFAGNVLAGLWAVLGPYPFVLILSIAEIPVGLIALALVIGLMAALVFRNKKQVGIGVRYMAARPVYAKVLVTVLASDVVYQSALGHVPQNLLILYSASLWLLLYLTRPLKNEKDELSRVALVFAVASVVALLPVLTIRQVDDNLALARLSYLATSFSVPALVVGVCAVVRRIRARQAVLAAMGLVILTALFPVVGVWARSVRLSKAYVHAVQKSKAARIFVLISPGVVPSATTIVLAGPFLDASGRLVRDDNPEVLPAYYADSLTVGDQVTVAQLTHSTWRIMATAGPEKYRSGNLILLPCFDPTAANSPFQTKPAPGVPRAIDVRINRLRSTDDVFAVTGTELIKLKAAPP